MKTVCLLLVLFAFGCTRTERAAPPQPPAVPHAACVILEDLVRVDTFASVLEYPLVCGVGRDFPAGHEIPFRQSPSREFVHAVFPKGITPPSAMGGSFLLCGHYQTIQNRTIYTLKHPPADYKYFVVSSWEHKE